MTLRKFLRYTIPIVFCLVALFYLLGLIEVSLFSDFGRETASSRDQMSGFLASAAGSFLMIAVSSFIILSPQPNHSYQNKILELFAMFLLLTSCLLILVPLINRNIAIDDCLDRGGSWRYASNLCDY